MNAQVDNPSAAMRPVALLLTYHFLLALALVLLRLVATAHFLSVHGVQSLPQVYLLAGVGAVLTVLVGLRVQEGLGLTPCFVGGAGLVLVVLVLARAALSGGNEEHVSFALLVGVEVLTFAVDVGFGVLANRLLDLRQRRRVLPRLATAEFLALLTAGGAVIASVGCISVVDLLYLAIGAQTLGVIVLFNIIPKWQRDAAALPAAFPTSEAPPLTLGAILHSRYLILMIVLTILSMLTVTGIDFAFLDQLAGRGHNRPELALLLGQFGVVAGLVGLAVQRFLAEGLIRRWGILGGLLIVPLVLIPACGAVGVLGWQGDRLTTLFWLACAMKAAALVLTRASQRPAQRILYQPLSSPQRVAAQLLIEGLIEPGALGLAGLFLLLGLLLGPLSTLGVVGASGAFLIGWLCTAGLLERAYGTALRTSLERPRANANVLALGDGSSRKIIRRWLRSSDPLEVVHALQVLDGESDAALLDSMLIAMLSHSEATVRREVLERIERRKLVEARAPVAQLFEKETVPALRGVALRVLIALGEGGSWQALSTHLQDPETNLRQGALIGFLRHGDPGVRKGAIELLLGLTRAQQPADRAMAAAVMSFVHDPSLQAVLLQLLNDADLGVRRAALRAAARNNSAALWPGVLACLKVPGLRSQAVGILAAAGPSVVPTVDKALDRTDLEPDEHIALLRLCPRLGGAWAIKRLLSRLDHPQARLRREACHGLLRLEYIAQDKESEACLARVHHHGVRAAWLLAALRDFQDESPNGPLALALHVELNRCTDDMLQLLALIYPRERIQTMRERLASGLPDARAEALAIVDELLPKEIKRVLLPLVEELPQSVRFERLRLVYPQDLYGTHGRMKRVVTNRTLVSPWTRASAIYEIGWLDWQDLRDLVDQAVKDDEPLVCETAQWTLQRLDRKVPMLPILERVLFLKKVGLFRDIAEDELIQLAGLMRERDFPAGATILKEGDTGRELYIIVEGKARVSKDDQQLAVLTGKDVFGELAALDPQPRSASVTALEPCRVLELDHTVLLDELMSNNELARGVIRFLVQRFRNRPG